MYRYTRSGLAVFVGVLLSSAVGLTQAPAQVPAPATKPAAPAPADAQAPISVAELKEALGTPTTVTATVSAVDYDSRVVVFRDEKGADHALYVGDDVKRLKELKAGDRVRVTFYMSLASRVLQPGEVSRPGLTEGVVGTAGRERPGGTTSIQERWTVTVKDVDPAQQTLSVTGEKGRTFTFKVAEPAKLSTVKPGDRIEVVFTAAAILNVEPAK